MVSLLKKTGNSTRVLLPPLSNQHSNKAFDVYNQRNREVHGRVATFSRQDHSHHIKRVLPGPVDHFREEFCQIN